MKWSLVSSLCASWLLAGLLVSPPPSRAGDGEVLHFPTGRTKLENGLRMTIDTRWVSANGYHPVKVELIPWPPGPAPADRTIHVELQFESWGAGSAASREIEIPEGSMGVTATLSVPQYSNWFSAKVRVTEDGRLLRDLSPRFANHFSAVRYYEWQEGSPAVLLIDSDAPDHDLRARRVQQLRRAGSGNSEESFLLPDPQVIAQLAPTEQFGLTVGTAQRMNDAEVLTLVSDHPHLELLPPSELPEGWINYSCFDLIVVSYDDLQLMETNYPGQLTAIRDWAVAGGSLCVFGVGDKFQHLPALESALSMEPRNPGDRVTNIRGWTPASPEFFGEQMFEFDGASNGYVTYGNLRIATSTAESPAVKVSPSTKPPAEPPFTQRKIGTGRVIAMSSDDPFPGDNGAWVWIYNTLSGTRLKWYQRHGVSFTRRNADYWNLLVPDVGMPPVTSFLILISLFAVIIGPVNYWMLRRSRRLYMLVFTVPAGAAVFTFCLLIYAVVADGLGAKVRVRSYTSIDQRSGETVSWSRQTYYAALIPSGGVRFPDDAAVYPVELNPNTRSKRELMWDSGSQRLAKGYIRARTATQFLVVCARRTNSRLEIAEGDGGSPSVTNGLGARIQRLVLVDSAGEFHVGSGIDDGASQSLQLAKAADARRELRELMAEARPQLPEGFDPYRYDSDFFLMDIGPRIYYGNRSADDRPTFTTSVLERQLGEISSAASIFPQRTYYAIVDSSPAVPMGIPTAKQRSSFHIIKGQW